MEIIEEIEKLIDNLVDNKYGIKVTNNTLRGVISTDIVIPKDTIPKEYTDNDIVFRLIIDTFSLKIVPRLYCITSYCFPHFADGRDLFKELRSSNDSSSGLSFDNLLTDILEFVKINFERGGLIFCGNYYLGTKYDLRILQKGCQNIINVKENVVVNGKKARFNRVLILSDVYFLLFEKEKWSKTNLTLLFWSSFNNIDKIQKLKDNKTVIIHWIQKSKDNPYLMSLTINNRESFIQDLLEKMKTFGMNFDIMRVNKDNKIEHNMFSSSSKLQKNKKNQINDENEEEEEENEEEEEDEKEGVQKDEDENDNKNKINEEKKEDKNNDDKQEKKENEKEKDNEIIINEEENKKDENQKKEEINIEEKKNDAEKKSEEEKKTEEEKKKEEEKKNQDEEKKKEEEEKKKEGEEKKNDEDEIKVDIDIGKGENKKEE